MALSPTRLYREPGDEDAGGEERLRYHVLAAHVLIKSEHQLAEYVARLDLGECARILGTSPLPALTARDPVSRVGRDESRSFEGLIRAWTLRVLSGVEGG